MPVGAPYLVATTKSDTTSSASSSITTNANVNAGDTLFVGVCQRLGTQSVITTLGGVTANEIASFKHPTAVLAVSIARSYQATLLSSGTAISITLDNTTTRKVVFAFAVPGLANQNLDTSATGSATSNTTPTAGPTGTTVDPDAIAIALFAGSAVAGTDSGTPNGGYTELVDLISGASVFCIGYVEALVLTTTGTQTASYTVSGSNSNWCGLVAVWDGAAINVTAPLATATATGYVPATDGFIATAPLATATAAGKVVASTVFTAIVGVATAIARGLVATASGGGGSSTNDSGGPWYRPIIETLEGWSPWHR